MKIWLLPIEPFDHRYTWDWYNWWPAELIASGYEVGMVEGNQPVGEMTAGEFLDPINTWIWKGEQVANLAKNFRKGIKKGDIILTLDGWGPATTAACYMRDTTDLDVKVVAFFHAGSSLLPDRNNLTRASNDCFRCEIKTP